MTGQEIAAAVSSIKVAIDIIKGINALNVDVAVKQRVSELYDAIISVQTGMLTLQSEYQVLLQANQEFEKKLMELDDWSKTEKQYDLYKTTVGSIVRVPSANHPSPEPLHWLCANCFNKKIRSILQKVAWLRDSPWICPECKTQVHLGRTEWDLFW